MAEDSSKEPLRIILVDDEEISHQTLCPYLRDSGHVVESAHDGSQGLKMLQENEYDLALVDVRMPGMDGIALLSKVTEVCPDLAVIIITGHGDMATVIQALRQGAADFLTKPIKLMELDAVLEKALRVRNMRLNQRRLRETIGGIQSSAYHLAGERRMVGESKAMQEVKEKIRLAVEADCETILITGGTGTGKELVAREVHFSGKKEGSPFIAVSCPALPETLVESELFGHVKGAFTGATVDRPGYFELADGGTLLLDEVADLSHGAQAKLLRALETRKIRRVGGSKEIDVNVQVVAATNTPLDELVKSGRFRQDLYYRLNVFTIDIPPLRKRPEDIIPLAEHFLKAFITGRGFKVEGFSQEAKDLLLSYNFPGNARELRNLVERAAILCRSGMIRPEHLHISDTNASSGAKGKAPAGKSEREMILEALQKANWNRRLAAKELGMPYSTIRYKIDKYNIK